MVGAAAATLLVIGLLQLPQPTGDPQVHLAKTASRAANDEARQKPKPSPSPVESSITYVGTSVDTTNWGTGPCPAIPPDVVMCESGGDYDAENAYSTASGCYQIVDDTWNGYGGYSHASDAPPAVQDRKAAELWAGGAGASHWASCL